ncbi:MAG: response regulator [Gammaproteobacteria bacterium]|nr:response regulator [Gammaproteobacteria bacterium]
MKDIKILVVDDVASMRNVTKSILMIAEYTDVAQATDGIKALELLKDEAFDLIICDWEMPNMNGLELLIEIKKDEKLRDIPMLMLTSNTEKAKVNVAIKAGASDYVIKPIQPSVLLEKIENCLS